jgi:hypothetical protein
MGLVTKPFIFTDGQVAEAPQVNSDLDTLYNVVNGNLSNTNISASAAIVDSKLAQITTGGKVSGAALTSLSSIPAGAGVIPAANIVGVGVLGDGSVNPTNLLSNGDFESHLAGATAVPDGFVIYGTTPTLATDTGDIGYGSVSQKITAAGSTLQGLTYTLTGLRASVTYSVSWRTKVTSGNTSQVKTTGAGTNLTATESTSTTFETKTGTFITDASGTNVVLYFLAKANTDVVWFDGIQVNQGASAFAFSPDTISGTSANQLLRLNGSAQIPAVSGALLTNLGVTKLTSYTGTTANKTLAHGLGSTPTWAIFCNTDTATEYAILWFTGMGSTGKIFSSGNFSTVFTTTTDGTNFYLNGATQGVNSNGVAYSVLCGK